MIFKSASQLIDATDHWMFNILESALHKYYAGKFTNYWKHMGYRLGEAGFSNFHTKLCMNLKRHFGIEDVVISVDDKFEYVMIEFDDHSTSYLEIKTYKHMSSHEFEEHCQRDF